MVVASSSGNNNSSSSGNASEQQQQPTCDSRIDSPSLAARGGSSSSVSNTVRDRVPRSRRNLRRPRDGGSGDETGEKSHSPCSDQSSIGDRATW